MFKPNYQITPHIASLLIRLTELKQEIESLPIEPEAITTLREDARIESTHYSTYIEGNRLSQEEVSKVVHEHARIPSRQRDEREVLGYFVALKEVEQLAKSRSPITTNQIQKIHALVMGGGDTAVEPTPWRVAQNVIRDGSTGAIVYLPPEAKDVPALMEALVVWLNAAGDQSVPFPIIAAIAHYQFATIHPYMDGNGRVARLLATWLMHRGSYGLKGIYSLEKYYATNLSGYYQALDVGPGHNISKERGGRVSEPSRTNAEICEQHSCSNYYSGREDANITSWVTYFTEGAVSSFEQIRHRLNKNI